MDTTAHSHNPIAWAMRNRGIISILTGFLVLFGIYSLATMPRQEFPEFTIRQGLVVGVYPGASSEEVEQRLTRKVEDYLFSFKEVDRKKTWSISREGEMFIFVEVAPEVTQPEFFWSKLRLGLQEFKAQNLPPQVLAVAATNDFGDVSALVIALRSKQKNYRELDKELDHLKDELRKIPDVSKVRGFGLQQETIRIRLQRDKMAAFRIQPSTVWTALHLDGGSTAAGTLHDDGLDIPIHLSPAYHSEDELANTVLLADASGGTVVRLRDVAEIVRDYDKSLPYVEIDGERCLLVSLEMKQGRNIVAFGKELDKAIAEYLKKSDGTVEVTRVVDMPGVVATSVNHFMRDFGLAILSVILVTVLLLPFRVAAVAAATVPICVLLTIGIMQLFGLDLNTVTLASLVIVLGMIVDNAIIVIDDHVERLDQGESVWDAAFHSSKKLFIPVFTATLAILAAYLPLQIFMDGTSRDFIKLLPITVTIALTISLVTASLLVPILNMLLIRTGLKHHRAGKESKSFLDHMQSWYGSSIDYAFRHPRIVVGFGLGSIVVAGLMAGVMSRQLFPSVDRNQFAVEVYMPQGTGIDATGSVAKDIARELRQDSRVVHVATFVGTSSPRFHAAYAPNMPAPNYAQLLVVTESEKATEDILKEYSERQGKWPGANVRWKQLALTFPKSPVEIRVVGDSLPLLHEVGDRVREIFREDPGNGWIEYDFMEPKPVIRVDVDGGQAAWLGSTRDQVAMGVSLSVGQLPAGTLWEGDKSVSVVLDGEDGWNDVGSVGSLLVPSANQVNFPLRQVASVQPGWDEGQIMHRNGFRTLTVRADSRYGHLAQEAWNRIRGKVDTLSLPPGVRLEQGGDYEAELENYPNLFKALSVTVAVIYLILLFQFSSTRLSLLVMVSMLFGLFGAIFGLVVLHYPFGFTSFIGILGLFGIAVRNGIILLQYAEELRKSGLGVQEAAMLAGKRRLRPVFLTGAAAAVGVVPLITSGSTLWGPLGTVVCFGLASSLVLTLLVLPVLYWGVASRRIEESVEGRQ